MGEDHLLKTDIPTIRYAGRGRKTLWAFWTLRTTSVLQDKCQRECDGKRQWTKPIFIPEIMKANVLFAEDEADPQSTLR